MIEFFGTLSEQCQKDTNKRTRKMVALVFTCFTILLGVVPTVVLYLQADEDFYEFAGLTVLLLIVTVVMWLPINVVRKPPKGVSTDILVRIEDSHITRSGFGGVQTKPLSKVKKVIDAGDWYYVVFSRLGDLSNAFVCQKDLLTQGTLEDFEKLFEGKLVRKYKY